jgi:hypothetical protein
VWYGCDGLWVRGHYPLWFKIPSNCNVEVNGVEPFRYPEPLRYDKSCNPITGWVGKQLGKATITEPAWSTDPLVDSNKAYPFEN